MTTEEIIEELGNAIIQDDYSREAVEEAIILIKTQPQIVYCKDCKYQVQDYCALWDSDSWETQISDNDFCSLGERRTECIEEEKPKKKKSEKSSYELERGL